MKLSRHAWAPSSVSSRICQSTDQESCRLVYGLLFGLVGGLLVGLVAGLGDMLVVGLDATIRHYTLRFWLWRAGCTPAPWQFVAFLDDAVEQLLLRKVGGGYIFRHRLLQDYFASLDIVPPYDPSVRAEARSV
jgi:hypothetical protein